MLHIVSPLSFKKHFKIYCKLYQKCTKPRKNYYPLFAQQLVCYIEPGDKTENSFVNNEKKKTKIFGIILECICIV